MINKVHIISNGSNVELVLVDEVNPTIDDSSVVPIRPSAVPQLMKECQALLETEFYTMLNEAEGKLLTENDNYNGALVAYRERTGMGFAQSRQAYLKFCEINGINSKREKL